MSTKHSLISSFIQQSPDSEYLGINKMTSEEVRKMKEVIEDLGADSAIEDYADSEDEGQPPII